MYAQGLACVTPIWVDKETGVSCLYRQDGNSGGLTPLLSRDGTPPVTAVGTKPE